MGNSEIRSNRRNGEDGVPVLQKEAAKVSAPPQSSTVVGFGEGAVALKAIRTGEGEGEGEGSSSVILNRAKLRKRFHNVAKDDDFLIPCHGSNISKEPDENVSWNDLQLEYIKPIIDNVNGSVMISSDLVNKGSSPYSRTLYGFFIEEKDINFPLVDHNIRNMWKTHGIEDIMMNDRGFYFFKFKTDSGMLGALENGPWTIKNTPLFLKRWTPGLILDDKLKLPIWIRIYDMPLELWNKNGLNVIASMLGNPLVVDSCTARMFMKGSGRAGYARVLVDLVATGNWPDEISVSVPYANGYSMSTLRVEYSWKLPSSSFCNSDSNCIHQKDKSIDKDNQPNESLENEQQKREEKRRYKAHPDLYIVIKVARDEDLLEQIGKDIFFDLVDHDKVRSFHIMKQMTFNLFKEEVAKEFGVPVQFQRFWFWAKRANNTYRPNRPLTAHDETQSVEKLRAVSNKSHNGELKLFLEIEIGPDLRPLPPPEKSKDDILVFFKLYDPEFEQLLYVCRFFVKKSGNPTAIISKLNERAGFSTDEELELYLEIKSEPCMICERLDKTTLFVFSLIGDGDIIWFQKPSQAQGVDKYRYPNVLSFLEYVKSCDELQCLKSLKIVFHHATKAEPVIHNIMLPEQSTVGDILNEIKTKVKLSHPDAKLRLLLVFNHQICKIIPLTEKIENIYDESCTLRAEEIPEEEKNMGHQKQLIRVYHFTKEATQNQMQMQNFGEPFFLIIHEKETLAEVKVRIQNKLEVPDGEFSKWKFAFVSQRRSEYLQDSDVVSTRFQRRGLYENWEQYLGLEHVGTFGEPVKIYN